MSLSTGLLGQNNPLALDGGLRVFDDTTLEMGAEVVNGVGCPAMHVRGTLEDQRICEGTFTTSETWSTFAEIFGESILRIEH